MYSDFLLPPDKPGVENLIQNRLRLFSLGTSPNLPMRIEFEHIEIVVMDFPDLEAAK